MAPDVQAKARVSASKSVILSAVRSVYSGMAEVRFIGSVGSGTFGKNCRDIDAMIQVPSCNSTARAEQLFYDRLSDLEALLGAVEVRENRVGVHSVFNFCACDMKISLGVVGCVAEHSDPFEEILFHPAYSRAQLGDPVAIDAVRFLKAFFRSAECYRWMPGFAVERLVALQCDPVRVLDCVAAGELSVGPLDADFDCQSTRPMRVSYLYYQDDLLVRVSDEEMTRAVSMAGEVLRQGPEVVVASVHANG